MSKTLHLDKDVHSKLKQKALDEDKKITELGNELLREKLRDQNGK
jgi:hypothetical protein